MWVFSGAAMGSGLMLLKTLLVVLMGPPLVAGTGRRLQTPDAAAHFLHQRTSECRFANGTAGEVRLLERLIYDRQEIIRFDSRRGEYEALTELGEPNAHYWNGQKETLDYMRAAVESFCRYGYGVAQVGQVVGRTVEPTVKISHTKADPLAHHSLLICTVTGYYPSEIHIKWLKNGEEQAEGVGYSEKFQNGDWTFQDQVLLETVPQRGDLYACQVEHSSLKEPLTVQWEPRMSDSSKSKMWTGGVGALLGVVFGAIAVSLYLKKKKALPRAPAAGLIG